MRPKAIKDLLQLSDKDFFIQISIGYEQILKHAVSLDDDSRYLAKQKRVESNRVLSLIAEEESAKCLILMDAVRCPRVPQSLLCKHLLNFNDHLAKALYSEACYVMADDFAELINYVDNERKPFYLDGPNDYDWIWRNRLVSRREEALYVDYTEMDDGNHIWLIPNKKQFWIEDTSFASLLSKAFYDAGCTTASSLQVISEFWRGRSISPSLTYLELRDLNIQTLDELNKRNLLQKQSESVFRTIIDTWTFPMYSLEMKMFKVSNEEELRKMRKQWFQWLENGENSG